MSQALDNLRYLIEALRTKPDIQPGVNSSSPMSPGLGGATSDAVKALQDYFVGAPARQIQADRLKRMDAQIGD